MQLDVQAKSGTRKGRRLVAECNLQVGTRCKQRRYEMLTGDKVCGHLRTHTVLGGSARAIVWKTRRGAVRHQSVGTRGTVQGQNSGTVERHNSGPKLRPIWVPKTVTPIQPLQSVTPLARSKWRMF